MSSLTFTLVFGIVRTMEYQALKIANILVDAKYARKAERVPYGLTKLFHYKLYDTPIGGDELVMPYNYETHIGRNQLYALRSWIMSHHIDLWYSCPIKEKFLEGNIEDCIKTDAQIVHWCLERL